MSTRAIELYFCDLCHKSFSRKCFEKHRKRDIHQNKIGDRIKCETYGKVDAKNHNCRNKWTFCRVYFITFDREDSDFESPW